MSRAIMTSITHDSHGPAALHLRMALFIYTACASSLLRFGGLGLALLSYSFP